MREALSVIAEVTNSERLRQFLATGSDRGSRIMHWNVILLTFLQLETAQS